MWGGGPRGRPRWGTTTVASMQPTTSDYKGPLSRRLRILVRAGVDEGWRRDPSGPLWLPWRGVGPHARPPQKCLGDKGPLLSVYPPVFLRMPYSSFSVFTTM